MSAEAPSGPTPAEFTGAARGESTHGKAVLSFVDEDGQDIELELGGRDLADLHRATLAIGGGVR